VALQTGKGVPFEYLILLLSREFHCLPEEIKKQPREEMEMILDMMNIEGQFQKRKEDSETRKLKSKYAR